MLLHGPPERRVLALGDMIVQHDEIADVPISELICWLNSSMSDC
jgi:hypothetical protein